MKLNDAIYEIDAAAMHNEECMKFSRLIGFKVGLQTYLYKLYRDLVIENFPFASFILLLTLGFC